MNIKDFGGVPETENSQEFHQGMVDRMGVSWFKYGPVADAYPSKVRALTLDGDTEEGSLEKRLQRYRETGNREWLMDVANFAMIEFMHPRHPAAHFRSTDSHESPGRRWNNGTETDTANTVGRENVKRGGSNLVTSGGFYKNEGD
jgi:hypothetical protein